MAKRLPDGWKQTFCTLIAEGYTINDAAVATHVATGTVRRHMTEDPEFRELYMEAREQIRDTLRNEIWKLRLDPNDSMSRWAYDHLIKWNLPEAKERLELDVAGTVQVTHEARLTLAHVLGLANRLGLDTSARPELPAAREILAEPPTG